MTTEPTLQWVVLIGIPRLDAKRTVSAEPISITKPLKQTKQSIYTLQGSQDYIKSPVARANEPLY